MRCRFRMSTVLVPYRGGTAKYSIVLYCSRTRTLLRTCSTDCRSRINKPYVQNSTVRVPVPVVCGWILLLSVLCGTVPYGKTTYRVVRPRPESGKSAIWRLVLVLVVSSCHHVSRIRTRIYGYAFAARPTSSCPRDQVRQGLKIADCNRNHR